MKLRKTIKQIVALGTGATMLGATLFGATAANLADYPSPFVKDGKANTWIVVGDNAAAADVIGAVDIATSLQAAAVSETVVNIPGTGTVATISNGYKVGSSSEPLQLNDDLRAGRPSGLLRDLQLPELLEDGKADVGDTDYDYTQTLTLGAGQAVTYAAVSDVPQIYIDLRTNPVMWTYELAIEDFDAVNIGSSASIDMLGKSFVLDPNMGIGDNFLTLYASEVTQFLDLNVPVEIQSEGRSYTLEVVGGNSDIPNIIIDVNGQRRTVVEGQTYTIGGLDVFIEDVFVTNIPTLSASATIFVGSMKVEVPIGAMNRIKVNGVTVSGVRGQVITSPAGTTLANDVTSIAFEFAPYNLRNDIAGYDRIERLFPGDAVKDPLFGTFSVDFDGMNFGLMDASKAYVAVEGISDELRLTYEGYYGNEVTIPLLVGAGTGNAVGINVDFPFNALGEGFGVFTAGTDIPEQAVFALTENFGTSEDGTKLYEVVRINDDSVELRDIGTGNSREYREGAGNEIGESGIFVAGITGVPADEFTLSGNTADVIYLKDGKASINVSAVNSIVITEDGADSMTLAIAADNNDLEITNVTGTGGVTNAYHRDRKENMYLSELGTYAVYDSDNDDYFEAWVVTDADNKMKFNVFVKPEGATITSGTTGGTVVTQTVNPIAVGTGKLASEVRNVGAQNMVVVGGPCANTVAAQLMGNPADCAEGFEEGKAIIKLFENGGNVAMLVAGYSATDTRRAARVVADYDQYSQFLSGTEVEVSGTSTTFMDTTVTVPTSN